ncbi:MAG: tryptophan synthase subunit alpha [Candidatus Nanopelagicales bacterium]|nr:tryptophan synthase subunit alpha [Candidatus Nanopelagicales bacterium]
MSALTAAFETARAEDRAALIGYLPGGFPDKETSVRLLKAMVAGGADVLEVGLPYSDPMMDGPVICAASETALKAGTTTLDVFEIVSELRASGAAITVMTYWNLIERYGAEKFAADLAAAGGCGVITPDLTPEEGGDWLAVCDRAGLDHVFLAAPSSTDERLGRVAAASSGFVYAASLMGVTGARSDPPLAAESLVRRLRAVTRLPIAVGLGVSTRAQAAGVAGYADGVIVGSAFVKAALQAGGPDEAEAAVAALAAELAAGVRRLNGE